MKKRLLIVVLLAMVLALAMAAPALAKTDRDFHNKLVVDVTYVMTNNYCFSPNVGVWGLMDQTMHMHVWKTGPTSYYQEYSFKGRWRTWAGVYSPGAGILQKHGASGPVSGHGALTFDAPALDPQSGFATRGYVGSFDVGGKRGDMGTWNMFPPNMISLANSYFPGSGNLSFVDLLQTWDYGHQSFVQYLATPGWPPSFGFGGDIVIH